MSPGKARLYLDIRTALERYQGARIADIPPNINPDNCHNKLSVQNVVDATVAAVGLLGLPNGSAGSFNLYKVMQAYLLDPGKRTKLNQIIS